MAVIELKDLSPSGALIGIDPGSKTLGIAASDELRLIASPVEVIRRGKKLAPTLLRLWDIYDQRKACLLYTSPSPRDATLSRMPSSA